MNHGILTGGHCTGITTHLTSPLQNIPPRFGHRFSHCHEWFGSITRVQPATTMYPEVLLRDGDIRNLVAYLAVRRETVR
ncbi:MAG: hypothetical protein JSR62_11005 [Nitrospira sp.]|nr:hypothetical protein [Nitrospira sp.]